VITCPSTLTHNDALAFCLSHYSPHTQHTQQPPGLKLTTRGSTSTPSPHTKTQNRSKTSLFSDQDRPPVDRHLQASSCRTLMKGLNKHMPICAQHIRSDGAATEKGMMPHIHALTVYTHQERNRQTNTQNPPPPHTHTHTHKHTHTHPHTHTSQV